MQSLKPEEIKLKDLIQADKQEQELYEMQWLGFDGYPEGGTLYRYVGFAKLRNDRDKVIYEEHADGTFKHYKRDAKGRVTMIEDQDKKKQEFIIEEDKDSYTIKEKSTDNWVKFEGENKIEKRGSKIYLDGVEQKLKTKTANRIEKVEKSN